MTKTKVAALILSLGLAHQTLGKSPEEKWRELNRDFNTTNSKNSFCYRENGRLYGENEDKLVTIASVSKVITSLWAIEELGADYQYETKFYLSGKKLHIEGSLDPVYSKRKLFFLLAQLNEIGVTELEEISFDDNTRVYTKAEDYLGNLLTVSPARTAANLKDFWNTPTWNKLKPAYQSYVKSLPSSLKEELNIPDKWSDLTLKVGKVYHRNDMPFPKAEGYQHLSPPISKYLKFMNIMSNNYIADQVFDKLGGEKGFDAYLEKVKSEEETGEVTTMKMYTGSGLNTTRKGGRVDNKSTCRTVTTLISRLDRILDGGTTTIQEVVAVPGSDGGTFRKRLTSSRMANTMVAKTGTLYHTSALAGLINSDAGRIPFGVFHQLTGWKGNAKVVQNKTVEHLWSTTGGAKFNYKKEFFFPASETLKALE